MVIAAYTRDVPTANQTFAGSQSIIENNFRSLDDQFKVNHTPLTPASGDQGAHHEVSLIQQAFPLVAPNRTSTATESELFTSISTFLPNVAAPFFQAGTGGSQYTYGVALSMQNTGIAMAAAVSQMVFDFAGLSSFVGNILIFDITSFNRCAFSPVIWDGTTLNFPTGTGQLISNSSPFFGSKFTAVGATANITSTINMVADVVMIGTIL